MQRGSVRQLIVFVGLLCWFTTARSLVHAQDRPINDDRANAIELVCTNCAVVGSNRGATLEDGETRLLDGASGKTVWWTWVATQFGGVDIDTFGSSFDTVLGIYRELEDGSLVSLKVVDDTIYVYTPNGVSPLLSIMGIGLTPGVRYFIAVDGYGGAEGDIQLNVTRGGSRVIIKTSPLSAYVGVGGSFSLNVTLVSQVPVVYQWEKNGVTIPGANRSILTVGSASIGDTGAYRVSVSNVLNGTFSGTYSAEASVVVEPIVGWWARTNLPIAFAAIDTLAFTVSGAEPISYQWEKDGKPLTNSGPSVQIEGLWTNYLGSYRVVASNQFGSITSTLARVTGVEPWTFVTLPRPSSWFAPHGISAGTNGTLLVTDLSGEIFSLTTNGVFSKIAGMAKTAGYADGPPLSALFNGPSGICLEPSGTIAVADTRNHVIRRIGLDGNVSTLSGTPGVAGYADGPATTAKFRMPAAIVAAPQGDLFVADCDNSVIRRIETNGFTTTWAGKQRASQGSTYYPIPINGPAGNSVFQNPIGLALDTAGNLFVADEFNQAIRCVTAQRVVTTIAGGGSSGFLDAAGAAAKFFYPHGPALGSDGSVFVADYFNSRIRRIDPEGNVVTIGGRSFGFVDGTGNNVAFKKPSNLVMGQDGSLYVADTDNGVIRKGVPSTTLILVTNAQDRTVAAGSGANFGVRAVGSPPLHYQWLKDGAPLDGGTATSLQLGTITNRFQAGSYSVVVSNDFQSVTSPPVHLTVTVRQQIQPPEPLPGGGFRLHFADEISNELPPDLNRLELQWRSNLSTEADTEWQPITNGFRVENGFIVLDLPPDDSPTNRFFRIVEH
jgi:sugar lactone lactonase YvrE